MGWRTQICQKNVLITRRDAALFLDAALIGLHLPQITRCLDQMFVDGPALATGAGQAESSEG
jgi:hypothetical protein